MTLNIKQDDAEKSGLQRKDAQSSTCCFKQKYIKIQTQTHRDSGNFVKVARLLVYMCPPTSMCTGALDLVSCAGVGMPWLLKGDTGDRVIMGLDMLERLSCKTSNIITQRQKVMFFFLCKPLKKKLQPHGA